MPEKGWLVTWAKEQDSHRSHSAHGHGLCSQAGVGTDWVLGKSEITRQKRGYCWAVGAAVPSPKWMADCHLGHGTLVERARQQVSSPGTWHLE